MKFQIIESSSAGNCAFFDTGTAKILIDAGIGIKRISSYLETLNLQLNDLDAIFITHEHIDHYRALKSFTKFENIKIFANRLTAETIMYLDDSTKSLNWTMFETGSTFEFMGISIRSFSVPHDTSDAVGYSFNINNNTLVWATDLGKVTKSVKDVISTANILVLESNYCPVMLDNSSRPYQLKQRIKNSHGHLSNLDAINTLKSLNLNNFQKIYLAHVSRQCNTPTHIEELLNSHQLKLPLIEVVPPCTTSSMFEVDI